MRLLPSDPDVETIVGRIKAGDIDLQPDFQRGEVWGKAKKQRLIDSILRDWHVPPIHVIENPNTRKQEVLDGQQRLVAIRDFVDEHFPVDGSIEPQDSGIASLDGLFYRQLPGEWRRRFNQFTIRIFRIVDYRPSEPGELFFRLNQPTSLTGAEQRNAFFGPVREQIKSLVQALSDHKWEKDVFGFSNSRMAYDDVLSRTALAIERNTLADKITSGDLIDLYRQDRALSTRTVNLMSDAVSFFARGRQLGKSGPKLNKATLFSWLMFLVRSSIHDYNLSEESFAQYLALFQAMRELSLHDSRGTGKQYGTDLPMAAVFRIYENRSVARVADISSVLLRDAAIWLFCSESAERIEAPRVPASIPIDVARSAFTASAKAREDDAIARLLIDRNWGTLG